MNLKNKDKQLSFIMAVWFNTILFFSLSFFEASEKSKLLVIFKEIIGLFASWNLLKLSFAFLSVKKSCFKTTVVAGIWGATCAEIFVVHIDLANRDHGPFDHSESLILIKFHGSSLSFSWIKVVSHFPDSFIIILSKFQSLLTFQF